VPVFNPPLSYDMPSVLPETHGVQRQLFRYYAGNPRGLSVVKVAGHYTTVDTPYAATLVGTDGVDWFLGGHVYSVTPAVAAALLADGYTTTVDPDVPQRNLPWQALAGMTWFQFTDDYGTWG
jgi:hypothetical protein